MAPPDSGSQSDTSEHNSLSHIEETLRRLEQSTLKIKRRNDEIIRSIDRCGSRASSSGGWKGSAIDVPPMKPPRPSQARNAMSTEVEQVLRESAEVKMKMQETLRQCEKSREQNEKYFEELKHEGTFLQSRQTTSTLPASLQTSTGARQGTGIIQSMKKVFQKFGSTSTSTSKTAGFNKTETAEVYRSLLAEAEIVSLEENKENTRPGPSSERVEMKVRTRPSEPPPRPPPPKFGVPTILSQLHNLKEFEISTSEEEMAYSRSPTPIPKPRAPFLTQESINSTSTASFDWVDAPLVIQSVVDTDSDTDSEDSMISGNLEETVNCRGLTVSQTSSLDERLSKLQNSNNLDDPNYSNKRFYKQASSNYTIATASTSGVRKKCNVRNEEAEMSPTVAEVSERQENIAPIQNPSKTRLVSPPPRNGQVPKRFVLQRSASLPLLSEESGPDSTEDELEILSEIESSTCSGRMSALVPGVPVSDIDIQIRPWYETQQLLQEEALSSSKDESVTPQELEQTIEAQFAFLQEACETLAELKKSCRYHKLCDIEVIFSQDFFTTKRQVYPEFLDVEESIELLNNAQEEEDEGMKFQNVEKVSHISPDNIPQASLPQPPPPPPFPPPVPARRQSLPSYLPITPLSEETYKNTIFDTLQTADNILGLDEEFIRNNFVKLESPKFENKRPLENDSSSPKNVVESLPLSLRQGIEIATRKIRNSKVSQDVIVAAIETLNATGICHEIIEILMQLPIKEDEEKVLAEWDGNGNPEGYATVKALTKITRWKDKLAAINILQTFEDELSPVAESASSISAAINSLQLSEKFPQILLAVLEVTNKFLQNGEKVKGFQLESLGKLTKIKSKEAKMTLLNYIVQQLEEMKPESLDFHEEFEGFKKVANYSLSEINKRIGNVEKAIEAALKEVNLSEKEGNDNKEMLRKLEESNSWILHAQERVSDVKEKWDNCLIETKKVAEYFGYHVKREDNLIDFFKLISLFIDDFKQAMEENRKKKDVVPNFNVQMRKNPTPHSKDRRSSLDPKALALKMQLSETGFEQPEDFLSALTSSALRNSNSPDASQRRLRRGRRQSCNADQLMAMANRRREL